VSPGWGENLRGREPIGRQLSTGWIQIRHPRRECNLGTAAEHRGRMRQRDRLSAQASQPAQPAQHRGPDCRRCDQLQRRHRPVPCWQALLARRRQKLAHEQRVATTQPADRLAKRFVGALVQLAAHDLADSRGAQRPEHNLVHITVANQPHEVGPLRSRITRAQPQQQQHRQIAHTRAARLQHRHTGSARRASGVSD
jgi:hypothetical protein